MSSQVQSFQKPRTAPVAWRSVGIWLATFLVGYMFFNTLRAMLNPRDFAISFGLPLSDPANDAFVYVYAIRALFLGIFGAVLIATRKFRTLALFVLVAVVMPIGDVILVTAKGAPLDAIIRQAVIVGFVLLTSFLLWRWVRISGAES